MRKSKRALALIMALAMSTAVWGCGDNSKNAGSNDATEEPAATQEAAATEEASTPASTEKFYIYIVTQTQRTVMNPTPEKTTKTTIPFIKDNEFDYSWLGFGNEWLTWLIYIAVAIFVVTAVSNGANLTDGLDGLLTSVSVPITIVLGALAYLSGHIIYADYLNIMYIPESAELVVFAAALCGALLGFLWYNSFPAQIFMGDTGSLAIGGIIAVFALCIRKELLLPLMCGLFLVESLSVMMQVAWFKYTKRKYGEGRRIFKMAPLHHHYQKSGIFETKIVMRFFILSMLLSALTLVTLKIR